MSERGADFGDAVRNVLASTDRQIALGNIALVDEVNDRFLVSQSLFVTGAATFTGLITGISSINQYAGTQTGTDYTSTSTSMVAVDTSHLQDAITIPVDMVLKISAYGSIGTDTAIVGYSVGILDGTALIACVQGKAQAIGGSNPFAVGCIINGDGASHTIALAYATTNASDAVRMSNNANSALGGWPIMIVDLTQNG